MAGSYDEGYEDGLSRGQEDGYNEGYKEQSIANAAYTDQLIRDLDNTYDVCGDLIKRLLEHRYGTKLTTIDQLLKHVKHFDPNIVNKIDLNSLFCDTFESD